MFDTVIIPSSNDRNNIYVPVFMTFYRAEKKRMVSSFMGCIGRGMVYVQSCWPMREKYIGHVDRCSCLFEGMNIRAFIITSKR